jgi:GT2 family glycosyltransferase/glycosyltransferase involved in cell wall biosynthesis
VRENATTVRTIEPDKAGLVSIPTSPGEKEYEVPEVVHTPTVSVVIVNYRGAEHTITCLRALRDELDYPAERLELICVDNASGDDSVARIKAAVPTAKVIEADANLGFAGGCNLGAKSASGEVVALLNNDARPDRDWVRAAVAVLRAEPTVAAVASKVLDWDGQLVDFVDGGLTWFGMGYKRFAGKPIEAMRPEDHLAPRDVLFATGSAMFVRAEVFAEVGGFDESFFMFYEDVDLGWRLNLRGWRVRYEPSSIAYHRHHASMSTVDGKDQARELFLLERNALASLYKNLSDQTLATVLPAAMALSVRRATARGNIDATQLEITRRSGGPESTDVTVPRTTLAGMLAIDQFVELLPRLAKARAAEQAARVRTDADLVSLMRKAIEPAYPLPRYLAAHEILLDAFGIEDVFGRPRKVLVLTGDAIAERMAGPAIRAWHMSDVLAAEHQVRLVTINPHWEQLDAPFELVGCTRRDLGKHVAWADIVVLQGHALEMVPELKAPDSTKLVVCDMYDPMHLELLEQGKSAADDERADDLKAITRVINEQLKRGDFFLCASDRQRYFWLGHLAGLGRLTPTLYDADPTSRSLLSVVPFGLSSKPPERTGPGIRGRIEGIDGGDRVVLWAGGVYSWFDPLTLVSAMSELRQNRPGAKLVFLGMRHPNPEVPEMDIGMRTRALAERLGLTGSTVFFNEGWVPYQERQNWLLDADCGVTTHFEHVETTFAFRTRVLDYLWAGLPIVTTDGDSFADLVRREGLGVVVPPENPHALAYALDRVLYDTDFAAACRERIARVREEFTWERALAPLVEYCRNPHQAADRLPGNGPLVHRAPVRGGQVLRRDLDLIRSYFADGGPTEVARRALGRVRRLAAGRGDGE